MIPPHEELARYAAELEGQSAEQILAWASAHFGPGLTFAASLGIEDCVLTEMMARQSLPIDLSRSTPSRSRRRAKDLSSGPASPTSAAS